MPFPAVDVPSPSSRSSRFFGFGFRGIEIGFGSDSDSDLTGASASTLSPSRPFAGHSAKSPTVTIQRIHAMMTGHEKEAGHELRHKSATGKGEG